MYVNEQKYAFTERWITFTYMDSLLQNTILENGSISAFFVAKDCVPKF